eukprot:COSAG01_NODE_7498_length_3183_cov_6.483787_3_plen_223_part_00
MVHLGYFAEEGQAAARYASAKKAIEEKRPVKDPPKPRAAVGSKHKGVCWIPGRKLWKAQISVQGVPKHLGIFKNEEEAAAAYQAAVEAKSQGLPVPAPPNGRRKSPEERASEKAKKAEEKEKAKKERAEAKAKKEEEKQNAKKDKEAAKLRAQLAKAKTTGQKQKQKQKQAPAAQDEGEEQEEEAVELLGKVAASRKPRAKPSPKRKSMSGGGRGEGKRKKV